MDEAFVGPMDRSPGGRADGGVPVGRQPGGLEAPPRNSRASEATRGRGDASGLPGSEGPGPDSQGPDGWFEPLRPGVVWLGGAAVPVERTGAERAVARISRNPGHLVVGGRRKTDALAAIDRWYRREARARIEPVVGIEGERLGLFAKKVRIGNQRTRWGSCSTTGTLPFNWRLVIGEPEALRYVVIHELVHLEHLNHSRRFWDALTAAMPDWKTWVTWLREHERALLAWQPRL